MSYVLHYAPDNASLIVRLALEELGLDYETRLVDRRARAQDSAAYRALNPAGLIPALETPEGVMFETGAILLYLADRHGALAPAPDAPDRGNFLKWLFFVSNTLHSQTRMTFYPEKYVGCDAVAQRHLRGTLQGDGKGAMSLPRALSLLDAQMSGDGPIGMLDIYVCVLLRWCALYPADACDWFRLDDFPALKARAQALEARPSLQRAARAEGLGDRPLTAPAPADPPEGAAL